MSATGLRGLENRFYALIRHRSATSAAEAEPAGDASLQSLAEHDYCLLVTYRRDGTPVPTPVWFALDGDRAVFESDSDAGKVKRLRRDPRLRIAPCNSRGKPLGPPLEATARFLSGDEAAAAERALAERYGRTRAVTRRLRPAAPGSEHVEVRAAG